MKNSLKLMFRRAKADKEKTGVSVKLREKYEKKPSRILAKKYKGQNTEKILATLRNQKDELFTFLEFGYVNPTSNHKKENKLSKQEYETCQKLCDAVVNNENSRIMLMHLRICFRTR